MNKSESKNRKNKFKKTLSLIFLSLFFSLFFLTLISCNTGGLSLPQGSSDPQNDTESQPTEPPPIQTPPFHKEFSGSIAKVLGPFNLPEGLYKITVTTSGFFQLFDVDNDTTIFNLFEGEGNGAETVFRSSGGDYTFRTDNISADWTLVFTNIDFSNPSPISDINNVTASVMKVLGPYEMDKNAKYKVTMYTNGFFQLFPINSITGEEESYIFNESSGNYGAQTVYQPSAKIMLFRTDNISEAYRVTFEKLQ